MTNKDPITLEIIQNSLRSISDEMFAAMRKTAMSAIIYEVLDMGPLLPRPKESWQVPVLEFQHFLPCSIRA